ncbi:hypothetical protein ABIA33_006431 [Streptacidiphilus sp. MAP12-16]|uniref:hypothetical protein n=1 Tax=Streptacidiphilus sp. MAP12-16 TaxID=3156300 RepID=UPI0035177E30
MLKLRNTRRAIAMAAASLALAGGATITTASTAHAYGSTVCTGWRYASNSGGGHGWGMNVCMEHSPGEAHGWVDTSSASNSTDVRVYFTIECPGNSYSDSVHLYFGESRVPNLYQPDGGYSSCAMAAKMTESGKTVISSIGVAR